MVAVGRLELPRPKASDFESLMSTNSIIPPEFGLKHLK